MNGTLRQVGSIVSRYLLVWVTNVLALLLATSLTPGFRLDYSHPDWWRVALLLPLEFAALIIILRPLLVFLVLPFNTWTLGLPTLLVNGAIFWVVAQAKVCFLIDGFGPALLGTLVFTVISTTLAGWLRIDEIYPFFQTIIYGLGRRFGPKRRPGVSRGLLILQIDGLSFTSLQRALERGQMPTVSAMLARASHRLFRWRCGVPSNTPAVQAGIFFGDRSEVPGYRWFDREAGVIREASNPDDVRALEAFVGEGRDALLEGGSCINSLLSGGAAKRLMTVTTLGEASSEKRRGELADFSLFWYSPWAYTRAAMATVGDFLTGIFWVLVRQFGPRRKWIRRTPRQLAMRALANSFLRETASFWIKQDLLRGVPVIFSNFVGYDEVAHFSGPDSWDSMASTAAFDRFLRRLKRAARAAPLDYEIVVFSDHGQTPSVPFRWLFGRTLQSVLDDIVDGEVTIEAGEFFRDSTYLHTLLDELHTSRAGRTAWAAARSRRYLIDVYRRRELRARAEPGDSRRVIVCVSGCLAHVYLGDHDHPLALTEIVELYPGLVEGLVAHKGIGFVAARRIDDSAVVLGESGMRDLGTSEVTGDADPLYGYGDLDWNTTELARLMDQFAAGDLVLNGAMQADGRVVVFEDQLSSHGGLGGAQLEPFAVLPSAWGSTMRDLESPEALHAHLLDELRQIVRPATEEPDGAAADDS